MNDSVLFNDSLVRLRDGRQAAYVNCTKPGDNTSRLQLLSFYADGQNSFSALLQQYYALALEMGADGIFHDEFPTSNYKYTYHSRWDNRSVFLDPTTLAVLAAPLPASLVLLTNRHELELARMLDDKDAIMVRNCHLHHQLSLSPWSQLLSSRLHHNY